MEEKTIIYFKENEDQYIVSTTETLEDVIEFVSKAIVDNYYEGSIVKYIKENIVNIKDEENIKEVF